MPFPTHRSLAAVVLETVGEHCDPAGYLDALREHLEQADPDLPQTWPYQERKDSRCEAGDRAAPKRLIAVRPFV